MSSGSANIISPMIIKKEVKEEDESCILFISSSLNGKAEADSLDVLNGHNYTSASKVSSNANNQQHNHHQNTSVGALSTLHRDRFAAVSTTANRSTVKRIDFTITKPRSDNIVSCPPLDRR